MSEEKREFLLPHPPGKRGGSGAAGKAAADPRLDTIESGQLRGRRAVMLGMVKALREHMTEHVRDLGRFDGIHGQFARDRARTIAHVLRTLERVARLPADPATDYRGPAPRGVKLLEGQ